MALNPGTDGDIENRIARLLNGAIDPHLHGGPWIATRALGHLELVCGASAAGFAVTKDHGHSGATAALITKHFPELTTKIFSSTVLNTVGCGLNPYEAVIYRQGHRTERFKKIRKAVMTVSLGRSFAGTCS